MSQCKDRKREKPSLAQPFCSTQTFDGLHVAHPHWGGQSALLILLFQRLISSRNSLPHTLPISSSLATSLTQAPSHPQSF